MRFNRVLLVIPEYPSNILGPSFPFPGIGYLAESLEKNNIEYDVIDMRLKHNRIKTLSNKIKHFKPELIGLHLMTFNYKSHYNIIKMIKTQFPDCRIVVGGPHLSTLREKVLLECPEISYGIVLEGEDVLVELCTGHDYSSLKGLIYRNDGSVTYTGDREFVEQLDRLPFPRYRKFELDKYITRQIGIITSRGCPYNCVYCAVNLCIGKKYRKRSPKSVVDEMEYWYAKGYSQLNILDDNFTLSKKRVYDICDEIEKRRLKGLTFACPNGIRATNVDRELLDRMRQVGFKKIFFGVEAGNNKVLAALRKECTIEQVEQVIKHSCELGYEVGMFFLLGSPSETMEDVEDSLRLAQEYPIIDAVFNNLIPYPNTELFDWVSANKYFVYQPSYYLNSISHFDSEPVFVTSEFTREERAVARKRIEKIRKRIRRNFVKRKLANHNFLLRNIAAMTYVAKPFQWLIHRNRAFRKLIERIR